MDSILHHYFPVGDNAPLPPRADVSIGNPAPGNNPLRGFPPELRRLILLEAFGNRVIHLDMFPINSGGQAWVRTGHACKSRLMQVWRDAPAVASDPHEERPRRAKLVSEPVWTWCTEVRMGVLGWLLSCRDAYLETVDVLYGSNTLHCRSGEAFIALPKLFAPERLAAVRDLHVFLDPGIMTADYPHSQPADRALAVMGVILEALPGIFSALKYLALDSACLDWFLWTNIPREDGLRATERLLLLIDDAVVRLEHLQECSVGLPSGAWGPWRAKATGEPPRRAHELDSSEYGEDGDGLIDAVWRDIPMGDEERGVEDGRVEGYWVRHGRIGCDGGAPPVSLADRRLQIALFAAV